MEYLIILIIWLVVAILVAKEGEKRRIGYWGAFFATFLLGFIGVAIVLFSDKLPEEGECTDKNCHCSANKNSKVVK